MKKESGNIRTLFLMIAAALFVVLLVALLAFFSTKGRDRSHISLPSSTGTVQDPTTPEQPGEGFLVVTAENVSPLVQSLRRPESYQQSLSRQTVSGNVTGVHFIRVWVRNQVHRIVITESGQTRNILTDGNVAYLWYSDEPETVRRITLPEGVSPDDLSGILTYESLVDIAPIYITQANYLTLNEDKQVHCLFVSALDTAGLNSRFWIDLSSGLLYKAECKQRNDLVYSLHQTELVVLDSSDQTLNDQMCLPDGTFPFAIA